ncbi:hypothetical protein COT30_01285 [Candidatus Micrarchaeota archaeon CG08_land_8_20_14_0_20_49_17]|nr:MAG: hypothetical protein COT30_01285 [Candidatus Micrarchaeota archaeon CG08_land_8_20_14_0_20_49_17]PIU82453.1 MAG: hypothetical protein COS70_01225 [Candidatus Micrarchaeota archaeon CG06_land_8_20_14_3_00_50_6]HII53550.1 hypothetical protein [Candidatus Micrarchaeota archaeon]
MNKIHVIFTIGIFILLAGCPIPGLDNRPPGQIAIDTAHQKTPEGGLANDLKSAAALTPQCTEEEFQSKASLLSSVANSVGGITMGTDKQLDLAANASVMLAEAKSCNPEVKENARPQADGTYTVEYTINVPAGCSINEINQLPANEPVLVIKVDPLTQTAEVVKGKLDQQGEINAQAVRTAIPLAGNCLLPLVLSAAQQGGMISNAAPAPEAPETGETEEIVPPAE